MTPARSARSGLAPRARTVSRTRGSPARTARCSTVCPFRSAASTPTRRASATAVSSSPSSKACRAMATRPRSAWHAKRGWGWGGGATPPEEERGPSRTRYSFSSSSSSVYSIRPAMVRVLVPVLGSSPPLCGL